MIDVEPLIVSGLNALVPAPGSRGADWADVRRRAGARPPRRRLVLVLAFVCAAVFVAIAIARTFGGFSGWLTGEPGKPAPPAAQQAFAKGIRSWVGFPSGTQLRQLAQTKVGGATYTLDGFRGAGSLCLRLEVTGSQTAHALVCPPLTQLRASPDPALVVVSDYGIGIGKRTSLGLGLPVPAREFPSPAVRVTLGIVADGISQVGLAHSDGKTTQAVVSGDAFLSVDNQPSASEHLTHVWAIAGGKKVSIPFTSQPTPFTPTTPTAPRLTLHGPATVQRVVHGGGIRWLARRQPEGVPVPKNIHDIIGTSKSVIFAREITPNPSAPERLVVSVLPAGNRFGAHLLNKLQVCVDVVGGRYANSGGGCFPAGQMFSTAPFTSGVGGEGSQYVTVAGLASDDVARLVLYLGTGQKEAVPLHDDGYLIEAPAVDEPLRLVAYDRHGLVIGTKPLEGGVYFIIGGPLPAQPVASAHWRRIVKDSAGQVFVAPGTNGAICYAVAYGQSPASIRCGPQPPADSIDIGVSWSKAKGATLDFRTGSAVARVIVHYRNGRTQTLAATGGFVLARVPAVDETQSAFRGLVGVTGLDSSGHTVATNNLFRLTGGSGTIRELTSSSISIGQANCQVTANSPSLAGYQTGIHVQYLCNDGVLTLIGRSKVGFAWGTRSVLSRGPITALTKTSITINNTLQATRGTSAPLTCMLTTTSPSLAKFHAGEHVQIFCASGKLTGINRI